MHKIELAKGQKLPPPRDVPPQNPIPFAVLPDNVNYWPIITKASQGRLVSYEDKEGHTIGSKGRKFLADRKTSSGEGRYHVAVDLFAKEGDVVIACEAGTIVAFKFFYRRINGDKTNCLLIRHKKVIVNYGEVTPDSLRRLKLKVGDSIKAGQHIGFVSGTKMLHFETYNLNGDIVDLPQRWMKKDQKPPSRLLNPTKYLLFVKETGLQGSTKKLKDPIEQIEWKNNPYINGRYDTWQAYKLVRNKVVKWAIRNPALYIAEAIEQWNANPNVQNYFGLKGNNFDGDSRRSYLNLKRLYAEKGITNPAKYITEYIVPITFFNVNTEGNKDLRQLLSLGQDVLLESGHTFILNRGTWSFVARTYNKNINKLSNHALGKAVDVNPRNNPHIQMKGEILIIDAVCQNVLTRGLLAEKNPDILIKSSLFFQQNFNETWIKKQTNLQIKEAIKDNRKNLDKYALHGFLNLPSVLIKTLKNVGLGWGGSWKSSKDFMHFEVNN